MKAAFATVCLLLLVTASTAQAQDVPAERRVIVKFKATAPPLSIAEAPIGALSPSTLPPQFGSLLTRFKADRITRGFPAFTKADTLRTLPDGRRLRVPDYTTLYVIDVPLGTDRDSLVAELQRLPTVEYAEIDQVVEARTPPLQSPVFVADPGAVNLRTVDVSSSEIRHLSPAPPEVIPSGQQYFAQQWGLRNTSGPDTEATQAWALTTGSSNTIIGIVDGSPLGSHVDLSGKVSGVTGSGVHGTHVTGIAAGKGSNAGGLIVGMDWQAQVYAQPLGSLTTTAQSVLNTVGAGARVINNSWGFSQQSATMTQALRSAYESGSLLVHANPYATGTPSATSLYPNNVGPWIVNVGAMSPSGQAYSNTGSVAFTDLGAPGQGVISASAPSGVSDPNYQCFSTTVCDLTGTSMAAPHVTGTASLMLAVKPDLRNYEIEHVLKRTAQGYPTFSPLTGYGMVNAYEAVRRVSAPNTFLRGSATFTKTVSNKQRTFTNSPGNGIAAGTYFCDVYRMSASRSYAFQSVPYAFLAPTEKGLSAANPNNGQPYLSESISSTSMALSTHFYYIRTVSGSGQTVNTWAPFDPTPFMRNGSYEYTVIGTPPPPVTASVSGPGVLGWKQNGTFTASVSGGSGSTSYSWESRSPGSSVWNPVGITTQSYSFQMTHTNGIELRVRVQRSGQTAYGTKTVAYCASSPCLDELQAEGPAFEVASSLPSYFAVHAPSPNPSRGAVEVRFDLPETADVRASVYDVTGREVLVVEAGAREAGYHAARFDTAGLPGGVYLVRVVAGGAAATQRITVVR